MRDAASGGVEEALGPLVGAAFPGCAYAVGHPGRPELAGVLGRVRLVPEDAPVTGETLFDLASLTKPLCTALLALGAWERGEVDLNEPVAGAAGRPFTPMDLLRHEAGFPAWGPLYGLGLPPGDVPGWLLGTCPRSEPRRRATYSCLGYILLGHLLERALGADLRTLFAARVGGPLGLVPREVSFAPFPAGCDDVAATEVDCASEARKAEAEGAAPAPLSAGLPWGVPNDGNARFLGGAAGNAGLFATARATLRLAEAFLPGSLLLGPRTLEAAWSRGEASEGERRTAGWKACETEGWTSGAALSAGSVGHEGYTGTGAWLDRRTGSALVLLTNRTHPHHPGTDFGPVRASFLRAALAAPEGGRAVSEEPRMVGEAPPRRDPGGKA